jgi:hypothetical protein
MFCNECGTKLSPNAKFCAECGTQVPSRTSVSAKQHIETIKGSAVGGVIGERALKDGLDANVEQGIGTVEEGGSAVGMILGQDEGNVHVGGEQQYGDSVAGDKREIQTGGGTYVAGGVNTGGGDFVGRDQVVHGDRVHGSKVGGDQITTGNISGQGTAIGRGARVDVRQGASGTDMAAAFAPLIAALQSTPSDKRGLALQKAAELQREAANGKDADDTRMAKLLDELAGLVPGAAGALVSTFASPLLQGIAGPVTTFVLEKIGAS